jgi:hypothetical protein
MGRNSPTTSYLEAGSWRAIGCNSIAEKRAMDAAVE